MLVKHPLTEFSKALELLENKLLKRIAVVRTEEFIQVMKGHRTTSCFRSIGGDSTPLIT